MGSDTRTGSIPVAGRQQSPGNPCNKDFRGFIFVSCSDHAANIPQMRSTGKFPADAGSAVFI
ncbi:MAG TPA: hypothetical protein DCZ61_03720 [Lachnospiraceae bacterium]|nr:hypothetical protein [Lachnospiraceae bacterium]